ncbi:hypothetical protein BGZ60DRAFT_531388 [Tricladium varicosporioides]|nr:hypothetical protein BGZ60DRAFT_531388 [Hymenoscyphus varicosporioides]
MAITFTTLTEFSKFGELPPEIRKKVWRFAQQEEPSAVVEISFDTNSYHLISLSLSPSLLRTSYEPRSELYHLYSSPPTILGAPKIFVDLEKDIVMIREDRGGWLANQNLLVRNIFGSHWTTTFWDLSGVRNLAVDYWVLENSLPDLTPLKELRRLSNFSVVLPNTLPQTAVDCIAPRRPVNVHGRRRLASELVNVGFLLNDIRLAIRSAWGVGGSKATDLAADIKLNVELHLDAGLFLQQSYDPKWAVPAVDLLRF